MSIRVTSGASRMLAVGTPWRMSFETRDTDGCLFDDEPVVTVTLPNASTVLPEVDALTGYYGTYDVIYTPLVTGRFTARAVATDAAVDLLAVVTPAAGTPPTVADLDTWLGGAGEHSWSDEDMADALAAETAAQMRVCRVPAYFPPDLGEALLRRSARLLAMRRQLTAEPRSEGDVDLPSILPGTLDIEVRRLEKPWRRRPIG